ncbi:MAG: AAA family ATPase [Deltaproteobacteria bacterium]|nr:AAA family ATPase [Deltaproteobacteria bacterium]
MAAPNLVRAALDSQGHVAVPWCGDGRSALGRGVASSDSPAPRAIAAPRAIDNGGRRRIVLTGGPGGGKTTAADLFRREIGGRVIVVPEAATMLFSGGFPRLKDDASRRAAQRAIFNVQRDLEHVHAVAYPGRVLLCDRGTIDGAAYWPGDPHEFFEEVRTTLEDELARYDAVLFFESAAVGGERIEGGNPARTESNAEAAALDARLRTLWSQHAAFTLVPHHRSFLEKVTRGMHLLQRLVDGEPAV